MAVQLPILSINGGCATYSLERDVLMTTQRQHVFDTIPGPGKVRRREYQGVRSDESLVSLTEYIRREVATVDWVNEHDFSLMAQAQDLVELAMELAWHRGLNAIDAIEGGLSLFGTRYLGTEEASFKIQIRQMD